MAGYNHLDFATPGIEQKHRDLAVLTSRRGSIAGCTTTPRPTRPAARRTKCSDGPTESLLSTRFLSAAYLPPELETTDLRAFLGDRIAPVTVKVKGPKRKVTRSGRAAA